MNEFTIGQVAKKAGVNIQTIYFYERRKLVIPVKRKDTAVSHLGYRIYTDEEVLKIRFIKKAQSLGFTLKEISDLLHLRIESKSQCRLVQSKTAGKIKSVEDKIKQLSQMKKALTALLNCCKNRKITEACPILCNLQNGRRVTV